MVFVVSGTELVGGEICEEEGEGLRTLHDVESEHKGPFLVQVLADVMASPRRAM